VGGELDPVDLDLGVGDRRLLDFREGDDGAVQTETLAGDLLAWLEAFLRKSLLWRAELPDGEPRVDMLATIREYGLERLAACGEDEKTQRRHAAYYRTLAERGEEGLQGADQAAAHPDASSAEAPGFWHGPCVDPQQSTTLAALPGLERELRPRTEKARP